MKAALKYGSITIFVFLAAIVAYTIFLLNAMGEAQIVHEKGKLHISSNRCTNSVTRIRIWEKETDEYNVFTTRNKLRNKKEFTIDLHNIPESFRDLAQPGSMLEEGDHYYIALDIIYDALAPSMRTQYFDFLYSEETKTIPDLGETRIKEPLSSEH